MLKRTLALITLALLLLLVPAASAGREEERTIALPDAYGPEGIASGHGASFYVGSIPQGSVYRGSYRTGEGAVLVPPHQGRAHTGLKVDTRFHRLFVAGGDSKGIYVYDSRTGADVASFVLPDAGFVNDVVLTRRAAYFTDSRVAQLYRVAIGRHGALSPPERIPLAGELRYVDGFNANGIDAVRGGRTLIVVQSNLGKLFGVDARTGSTREVLLDRPVMNGDGILKRGHTVYVVQNRDNKVAVVRLRAGLRRGKVRGYLTDGRLDVPTTISAFRGSLYAVNARFGRPDTSRDDIVPLHSRAGGARKQEDRRADRGQPLAPSGASIRPLPTR